MLLSYPFRLMAVLLLISYSTGISVAQTVYFPPRGEWATRAPEQAGFKADQLAKAVEFAQANEYSGDTDLKIAILKGFANEPYHEIVGPTKDRGGPAGVILKDGYLVAQWGDVERVDMTFSVTKSYLSTVAGLAADAKLIDVKDKVSNYLWDGTFESEHNAKITWEHLLTQSSDWSGDLFGMQDWADRPPREGGLDEWKNRKLLEPGTNYEYNDVRVNLLAYALLHVWRKPLPIVLKENIMDPIGASSTWRWYGYDNSFVNIDGLMMQSVSGGGHSGGGLFINTLDHARFGLLFLRNGNWNGKQLISKEWIQQARQPSAANPDYSYLWWRVPDDGEGWEGVPKSTYYAAGFGGNFIVIDEEHDLVVVTRWLQPSKIGEMMQLVVGAVNGKR